MSPDGELRAEVLVRTQQASVGLARDGIALKGVEASGIFSVVFKGARDGPSHYSVTMHGISGSAPGAVLDGLKFLHAFRPPNRFELRIAHGPQLAPAQEIPDGAGDPDGLRELVLICDALAEIQRHTPLPIRIPESISSEIATEWLIAAALLRGETVDGTWTDMPMTLEPGAALPDETRDQFMVMVTVPLAVTVGDLEVALGRRQLVCKTARLDPDSLGSERVRLTPGDDNMMTERRESCRAGTWSSRSPTHRPPSGHCPPLDRGPSRPHRGRGSAVEMESPLRHPPADRGAHRRPAGALRTDERPNGRRLASIHLVDGRMQ
ncbi:MAG: hypothetical protein ACR2MB_17175 [Acidimicrobiales bacterium]